MTLRTNEQEFLAWLEDQDRYWIPNSEVNEKFPDLNYRMIGVTMQYDPETGEKKTPARDWRQSVKYGSVTD
jgi:hypothetical protein